MSRNRGFTLLELLVALALMAVLSAALYGTYFTLVTARDRAEEVADRSRELRTTLDLLRRELASACYKASTNPDKVLFRFVVEDRDFFGKPASVLAFTTIVPPSGGSFPVSDQMDVEYRPKQKEQEKDQEQAMVLMRQTRDVYLNVTPVAYAQMEEMQSFLVECYDGNKWVRSWDSKLNGGMLPRQVRITLTVKEGESVVPYVALVVPRVAT
jgi:general secretion pathway protein J